MRRKTKAFPELAEMGAEIARDEGQGFPGSPRISPRMYWLSRNGGKDLGGRSSKKCSGGNTVGGGPTLGWVTHKK